MTRAPLLLAGMACLASVLACGRAPADKSAASQTLRAIVSWGRYGEVFAYDDETAMFSLENP